MSRKLIVSSVLLLGLFAWTAVPVHPSADDIRRSVGKSLTLLEISGQRFIDRSRQHCASCHHNLLTAAVEEKCRTKGIAFTDTFAKSRIHSIVEGLHFACNPNLQSNFIAAKFISAYALFGLKADHYPADKNTDVSVSYIMALQKPDGTYGAEYGRPPLESGEAHLASLCIYGIRSFASPAQSAQVKLQIDRTRQWLNDYRSDVLQEEVFQLLGLRWCGAETGEMRKIATRLLDRQNSDGSWSQNRTMSGDAYATGEVLYGLAESGMLSAGDDRYQQGIAWLLKHQDATGAWIVATRAYPIQPFFNSDFPPFDENQFISAAATNWACLALLEALPDRATAINN